MLPADSSEVLRVKPLTWSVLLILPIVAQGAEIYRTVGADGQVTYSDVPQSGPTAERITVNVPTPAVAPPPAVPRTAQSNAATPAASEPIAEMPRPSTPEEIAADRERNCELAQQKQATYSTAHRLYRNGPDGERVYLNDAELTEARAKAESDVAAWCD